MDSPQQICERYPIFVEKVFEMTESQDPTMIGVAVDTIGILGSNVEGKQVLQKTGWYDLFWFSLRRALSLSFFKQPGHRMHLSAPPGAQGARCCPAGEATAVLPVGVW